MRSAHDLPIDDDGLRCDETWRNVLNDRFRSDDIMVGNVNVVAIVPDEYYGNQLVLVKRKPPKFTRSHNRFSEKHIKSIMFWIKDD